MMTFVLSEIISDRVFMASDSAERIVYPDGRERIDIAEKTLYFPKLNIGISTWGNARVGKTNVNLWLKETVAGYSSDAESSRLSDFTKYLAAQLDAVFNLPRKTYTNDLEMGFHIGGYESTDPKCMPGFSHVFINKNESQFVPEMTQLSLEAGTASFLRNGMYEPFALMWNDLIAIDIKYKAIITRGYPELIDHQRHDPVDLHAEWIAGWVKQVCVTFKAAGMPEYVGKTIRALTFNNAGDVRTYELPEFQRADIK